MGATLRADVSAYTDSGLQPETVYKYQVSAFNGAGNSSPSDVAFATTPAGSMIELTAIGKFPALKCRRKSV